MKLSKGQNRIVGVILTEAKIGILSTPSLSVQSRFALIDEESNFVGESSRSNGFSTKVQEAVIALVNALEEDQMVQLFGEEETLSDDSANVSPKDIPTF